MAEGVATRLRVSLLVIDVEGSRRLAALDVPGRRVRPCTSARDALAQLDSADADLVVTTLEATDLSGLPLLQALRAHSPSVPLLVVADPPTVEGALAALRAGAVDYVAPDALADAVSRALAPRAPRAPADGETPARLGFCATLTRSARMTRVFDAIRAVARTDATVLVTGETGTGKELVARAIHERSRRKARPFVVVNCGAFAEGELEIELFGTEAGAAGRTPGVLELAEGGTVLLDEVGESSLAVQVRLLRALEDRRFRRVGGVSPVRMDVRVVAATAEDLPGAVADGRFREDLLYRLDVFPIALPPLRERAEDVPVLVRHFLDDIGREYELPAPAVTPDALALLGRARWPGNVRQLRAMCERWVVQCRGDVLGADALPAELTGAPAAPDGALVIDETVPLAVLTERLTAQLERAYLHKLLQREAGHLQNTAAAAGMTRRTLYSRMKALDIDAKDYK